MLLVGLGYTKSSGLMILFQTEDFIDSQADMCVTAALSLEASFTRNSAPICPRPYGSPVFMYVLNGDICGVHDTLIRCEGSLWDYDPYGLGLFYVSQ